MKIAFVYDALYPFQKGGGERRIFEIARRLALRGHSVELLGMKYWDGPDEYVADGITYRALAPRTHQYHASGRRSIVQALHFGWHSWGILGSGRFDVIDCGQWPYFHFLPARIHCWRNATPLVVSWYEVWGRHWFEYLGAKGIAGLIVEKAFCRIPDRLIAVSDKTNKDLVHSGVDPGRVVTIPNGIDFAGIQSVPSAKKDIDIICCGRLKNHKNLDVLIQSVAIVKKSKPPISLCLVGEGPSRPALEQMVQDLDLQANVTFTGALDDFNDVLRLMKRAKIFVNPSTKEGGGSITLFEANACGLPVIAVDSPNGIDPCLIQDGSNGFFVGSPSAELISAKILELLASPDILENMGNTSIESARRFDWDAITDSHETLYQSICRKSKERTS